MNIAKLTNIQFEKRTHCLICEKKMGEPTIDLPEFPMTELYSPEKIEEKAGILDQSFHYCPHCGHGQLANVIDVELQYDSAFSYNFRTSESATGRESSDFFIDFIDSICGEQHFKNIVEIGCNDLYLLKDIESRADSLIGIDPILKGQENEYSEGKVRAIGDFFENVELENDIDMIICKDALEHVSDPKGMVKKAVDRTNDETIFFFQFPLLETLLAGCRFDQVFHQHLNYFSIRSIVYMLDELGCKLLDYSINSNHWGAVLIAFKKGKDNSRFLNDAWNINEPEILERYSVFKSNMETANSRLSFLNGENVYGYGAALMLPVLSYYMGNDFTKFQCIIDDDKRKEGLYYVNLPVSISPRDKITDIEDSVVVLTAIASLMNVRRILSRLYELKPRQIILPLNTI
jgi:hypothetical protein